MDVENMNKRSSVTLVKLLKEQVASLKNDLGNLLKVSVSNVAEQCERANLGKQYKQLYPQYCDAHFKLVQLVVKSGSVAEADEIRKKRFECKNEVKELVEMINTHLNNSVSQISFNSSRVSQSSRQESRDARAVLGLTNHSFSEHERQCNDLDSNAATVINPLRASSPLLQSFHELEDPVFFNLH